MDKTPGKYDEDGTLRETPRVNLPFQVIETVNESRATREARKTVSMPLFDVYAGTEGDTFEEGWKNKLIWGDNLLVMGSLLEFVHGIGSYKYDVLCKWRRQSDRSESHPELQHADMAGAFLCAGAVENDHA